MKNILTISAIMAIISLPAFATITNNATCDTTNLGQSENNSTANVEADWTANTINIVWNSNNGDANITNTCTYDGTITVPATPTKTGYTFAGWQLRAANSGSAQSGCSSYATQSACNANSACYWRSASNACINTSVAINNCQSASDSTSCTNYEYCSWQQRETGRYGLIEVCAFADAITMCHIRTTQSECETSSECSWFGNTCYSITE